MYFIDNTMNKFPIGASVPPKIGEYGYFLIKNFEEEYYKIGIVKDNELIVPCHYSLKYYIPNQRPFIVSWGEINFVKNK